MRLRSICWNHFELKVKKVKKDNDAEKDVTMACCKHCSKEYTYTFNTSILLKHLKSQHEDKLRNLPVQPLRINQAACTDLAETVCRLGYSFRSISKCRILRTYFFEQYGVKLSSPNTVRSYVQVFGRWIIQKFKEYLATLKKDGCVQFHLIVDEGRWVNNRKILGLKLKVIAERSNVKLINIGIIQITKSSSASNIYDLIKRKLAVYGIQVEDLMVFVSVASNTMKAVADLMGTLHQVCYAHLIQLAINDSIYDKNNKPTDRTGELDDECSMDEASDLFEEDDFIDPSDQLEIELDNQTTESTVEESSNHESDEDTMADNLFHFVFGRDEVANEDLQFGDEQVDNEDLQLSSDYNKEVVKIRKIVTWFRSSANRLNAIKKYTSTAPILDCKLKWRSLHLMIKRFLVILPDIKKAYVDLGEADRTQEIKLSIVKSMVRPLELMNDVTNALSKADCNLQTAVHMLDFTVELLSKDSTCSLSKRLIASLVQRRKDYETGHYHLLKALTTPNYQYADEDELVDEMHNLYLKLTKKPTEENEIELDESEPQSAEIHPSSTTSDDSTFHSSFSAYLKSKVQLEEAANFDLKAKIKYDYRLFKSTGNLSDILIRILNSVKETPTSIGLERLPSIATYLYNKYRDRFDGKMLNTILVLRSYFLQKDIVFHTPIKEPY